MATVKWRTICHLIVALSMVNSVVSEETVAENGTEDPKYDRDPANREENKNNFLLGACAFMGGDGSSSVSDPMKEMLRKVIERSDLMMVANMPKNVELFPQGVSRAKRQAYDGVIPAIFYDERVVEISKFQILAYDDFEGPPAVAILHLKKHSQHPPIGLLMLHATRKTISAELLTAIYEKAQEILGTENIIIAGDLNVERPQMPESKPSGIPWYDGKAMTDISTPENCPCPWGCPCKRFSYLMSASGESSTGGGKPPYTKDFMWIQRPTEQDVAGSGVVRNIPFGKIIIGGSWLKSVVYPGSGRVHILNATYTVPPSDSTSVQIEYPVELLLKLGEGSTGGGGGETGEGGNTGSGGGGGGGSGKVTKIHLSRVLVGSACKKVAAMDFEPLKTKHPDVPGGTCWYGRICSSVGNCEKYTKHRCDDS